MQKIVVLLSCFLLPVICLAQNNIYKVAYNVYQDTTNDNYDIYTMSMDGSNKKNISNTPGVEWVYYAWQDKLYFISDRDTCHRCYFLYQMDANGNDVKKISTLQLEDSWMDSRNNGTELIVTGRKGKELRNQLFIINITNGSYQQLTNDTVSYKLDPAFIPGTNDIVLRYRPNRSLRKTVPDELWRMGLDGSNKKQLTYFPAADTSTAWFQYHAGPPQWNSKHQFISYISRQYGQTQIHAINADGSNHRVITNGPLNSGWHNWSPDGNWLVMDKSNADERGYNIYLLNYNTGQTTQLTNGPQTAQAPVFVLPPY
jgi:TolB protein